MKPEMITTIMLVSLAIFMLFALIGTAYFEMKKRSYRLSEVDRNDWLFGGIHDTIYDIFYKNSKSEKICGIDREEYARLCKMIHKKNDFKTMVAMRTEAVLIALVFLVIGYVMSYDMLYLAIMMLCAFAAFYLLWMRPGAKMKSAVENKLFYIRDDLPRFLSLLEKAMDLPIDQAMVATAKKFDSPLSEDLIDSINKVSLGANGWQETLLDLARTYDIEDFSDLVLEIINSYEQGVNIRPLITRKAYEVEQNRVYAVESHDAKIKTLIYIPIIGLKVLPLMALIVLPMAGDVF